MIPSRREQGSTDTRLRAVGAWLTLASLLMIAALLFHGPIAPDLGDQMTRIAASPGRWTVVHWTAAGALSSFAIVGLIALGGGPRLNQDWQTISAWSVLTVGALWTTATAVSEATVISDAAISGEREVFETWWALGEGAANGFAFLALAVAMIAARERRSSAPFVPGWSASIGAVAGLTSFVGWALGSWFGQGFGSVLWVVASVAMSGWTLWLGVAMLRASDA